MVKQCVDVAYSCHSFYFILFFLIFQFQQFNCHNSIFLFLFLFLAISLQKFLFLSPASITSFLFPFSYFFSKFWQCCCQNSLLSSFCQISLNSTHITNKLHFFTIFNQKTKKDGVILNFYCVGLSSVSLCSHFLFFVFAVLSVFSKYSNHGKRAFTLVKS